jgi:pimeloyl-ACP methyl ester carboxylesterase
MNLKDMERDPSRLLFLIDRFSEGLSSFLIANDLRGSIIFGYSMGGYVALYLELNQPGSFSKIITLGTKFDWNPESSAREVQMMKPVIIQEMVPKFAAQLQSAHGEKWKQVLQNTADMMISLGDNPTLNADLLSNIKIPVSIHVGDFDRMVSKEESQQAASQIPNANFRIVEGLKHPIAALEAAQLSWILEN